jgi:hypothetical protein
MNSRGLPIANRLLHSMAHIMDSLAPQLLQHLYIRGIPPPCLLRKPSPGRSAVQPPPYTVTLAVMATQSLPEFWPFP